MSAHLGTCTGAPALLSLLGGEGRGEGELYPICTGARTSVRSNARKPPSPLAQPSSGPYTLPALAEIMPNLARATEARTSAGTTRSDSRRIRLSTKCYPREAALAAVLTNSPNGEYAWRLPTLLPPQRERPGLRASLFLQLKRSDCGREPARPPSPNLKRACR